MGQPAYWEAMQARMGWSVRTDTLGQRKPSVGPGEGHVRKSPQADPGEQQPGLVPALHVDAAVDDRGAGHAVDINTQFLPAVHHLVDNGQGPPVGA